MAGAKLLLIEDDSATRELIDLLLSKHGYTVFSGADTGEDAIADAKKHQPDLVLMDIYLKDGPEGIDAAKYIREELGIAVIYLTAYHDSVTLRKASETRPYGYVTKPITKDQLFATIELALHTVKIEKERAQLIDEIKTLRGLLPICANCKNIRDDKGYWHEIEEYFTSRSEASFTHGICPKCQKKLYPGYDS